MRITDLLGRKFITLVELHPLRRSVDSRTADEAPHLSRIVDKVRYLQGLGSVDVVTVTESASERYSHSSLETARIISDVCSLPVIPHLTLREHSPTTARLLHKWCNDVGMRTLLIIRGDNYEYTQGGYQYSSDMIRNLHELNPRVAVGAACNPQGPRNKELISVRAKVMAGASYLITQPIFSAEEYSEYVAWLRDNHIDIPVIPGILPLKSQKSFSFVEKFIPEISIPQSVKDAHLGEEDIEEACVEFTRQLIRDLRQAGAPGVDIFSRGDVLLVERILSGQAQGQWSGALIAEEITV